jgi:hypothetical protein
MAATTTMAAMPAAMSAAMPTAMAATMAATMPATMPAMRRLRGHVGRVHQQRGYADGRRTIDADHGAGSQQAGQKLARTQLSVPAHIIVPLFLYIICK